MLILLRPVLILNKVVRGGVLVFDDYGIWGVDGIKKIYFICLSKI